MSKEILVVDDNSDIRLLISGILKDKSMTCHPSVQSNFDCYVKDRVVVDEKVITSQSPGTAMEFAMKLVEVLFDSNRVDTVNNGVMARI